MRSIVVTLGMIAALAAGSSGAALDAGNQYNLDQIRSGSPLGLKSAAESVHRAGIAAPEVLDALAEALLQHQTHQGDTFVEALSWDCKALAATGKRRYYAALREVADNDGAHRKLRKWCDRSAGNLGSAEGQQYVKGTVSLEAPAGARKAAAPAAAGNGSFKPITEVQAGWSMEQVYAIAGPPTSTNSYITGKAFIPFNFRGKDAYRQVAHYKGQGRIVFSNESAYTNQQRVLEVQIDPADSGYQ